MSLHDPDQNNLTVRIVSTATTATTTFYTVQVCVDTHQWTVDHRYSDFAQVNAQLLSDKLVPVDWLPPKKLLGNRDPAFVDRRRLDLEQYIQRLVTMLQINMPDCLAGFLQMSSYDVGWMLRRQAFLCFVHESAYVSGERDLTMTPMEVQGLTQLEDEGRADTFFRESKLSTPATQIVDVARRAPALHVAGSWSLLPASNIAPQKCSVSLRLFPALRHLTLVDVPIARLQSLAGLRSQLELLSISGAGVKRLRDVLLCGEADTDVSPTAASHLRWSSLTTLSLHDNHITDIDEAILFTPKLTSLNLASNSVVRVTADLAHLRRLRTLDLSGNRLHDDCGLLEHVTCGLTHLLLSRNQLSASAGFSRLLALERLDLSFNQLADVQQLVALQPLGKLRDVSLVGNAVTLGVDYRARALERLGRRDWPLVLDNEHSPDAELDRVDVVRALRTARDGGPEFLRRAWAGCKVMVL